MESREDFQLWKDTCTRLLQNPNFEKDWEVPLFLPGYSEDISYVQPNSAMPCTNMRFTLEEKLVVELSWTSSSILILMIGKTKPRVSTAGNHQSQEVSGFTNSEQDNMNSHSLTLMIAHMPQCMSYSAISTTINTNFPTPPEPKKMTN